MTCNGCSIGPHGKPPGCRGNGSCSSGSCNRMNVYDWLADVGVADDSSATRFAEVSFKNGARKEFYRNMHHLPLDTHDIVAVESGSGGYDIGIVTMTGELVRLQMKRRRIPENADDLKAVLRKANEFDLKKLDEARQREIETMIRARAIARQQGLEMKIGDVEFQGDGRKATFYYTANDRVDFRELIKLYAKEFHVKVEMHQIGARQEAGRIGGIGSCGRELCCSTWLADFKTVTTGAARYQQLAINQAKLSGQCGRLKCCLNYELDTYVDALKDFPVEVERIETEGGVAYLQKTDVFKRLMWFAFKDSTIFHPLTPERVREIATMNKAGQKPAELGSVQATGPKEKAREEYSDVVGQVSLESLEKKGKRKKHKKNKRKGSFGQRGSQPRSKT